MEYIKCKEGEKLINWQNISKAAKQMHYEMFYPLIPVNS